MLITLLLIVILIVQSFDGVYFLVYKECTTCECQLPWKTYISAKGCVSVTESVWQNLMINEDTVTIHFGCADEECSECEGKDIYPINQCYRNTTVYPGVLEKADQGWYEYKFYGTKCNKEEVTIINVYDPVCVTDPGGETSQKTMCNEDRDIVTAYYQDPKCNGEPIYEPYPHNCTRVIEEGSIQYTCEKLF